jgi:hypothetical protein
MTKVSVNSDQTIVTVTASDQNRVVKVLTAGPKGDKGIDGAAFTGTLTGSLKVSGSIILDGFFSASSQVIAQSFTGSLFGTASWANNTFTASHALTASYALNGGTGAGFPYTGSAGITGSLYVVGPANVISIPTYQSDDFFLIRNNTTTFKVTDSIGIQITSSTEIPLQISNQNNQSLFYVSQSGMIVLSTSSVALSDPAPIGGIYFTSTDFFVGLS